MDAADSEAASFVRTPVRRGEVGANLATWFTCTWHASEASHHQGLK